MDSFNDRRKHIDLITVYSALHCAIDRISKLWNKLPLLAK